MAKSKKAKKATEQRPPLSRKKKILFYSITLSIPVLFFVITEITLRSINYLGDTALFADPKIPNKEYLIPNPNFAARYFFYTKTVPSPSTDVFLKEKPENGYRVFAMGGSSAAGYPYGFNGTYSRVVQDVLSDALPHKEVEVVNVGISAISSYTLYDQVDEIIEQKPDAIMIYAGHNEFYGALGVGSNENLGGFPGFVRFYLKLQRFKTFMLLRTMIVDSGKWFAEKFGDEGKIDQSATLMERIVASRSIELDSPTYQLAMIQFQSNLTSIIEKFEQKGIPVYVGSVASNLKDHTPFVNITDGEQAEAEIMFNEAKAALQDGDVRVAAEKFALARDLDGLKFRAPSEINTIIKSTTESHQNAHYVPVEEVMTSYADDGIIGFDLMLEHLHPNQQGYFLIGRTFSEALLSDHREADNIDTELDSYFDKMYLSEYDHRVQWHRVATLKQGFPFITDRKVEPYQRSYKPISLSDSLALLSVHSGKRWDEAKVDIAQAYEKSGEKDKALLEYLGLIRNQPWNDSPYVFAARIYLDRNDFVSALPLLEEAFDINPNEAYITKMLGAIAVQNGNPKKGIQYLEISRSIRPNDPQMLYNLSGAYGTDQQFQKALNIAEEVISVSPNFPGIQAWRQQLLTIIQQQRN